MSWAAVFQAIATIAASKIASKSASTATNATNASSRESLAEQKRIFDLQRQDELQARQRRLAVAGERRQLIMGADGKMTLGPQMKTLGDYSVSGINPPALPPGPVNQNFTGTPLGGFGGGYDDGNKSLGSDANAAGAFGQITPNHPRQTFEQSVQMYKDGDMREVPMSQVNQMMQEGWSVNPDDGGQS